MRESGIMPSSPVTVEEVVLLSPDGLPIGTAPKAEVHGTDTPLHLAFSSYVFDPARNLLVTQRALSKRTWPGVWTNSCCGHPGPGESLPDAVARRLELELDLKARDVRVVLPDFRYRAVMDNGIVENEVCPVFRALVAEDVEPRAEADEVEAMRWTPWEQFAEEVLSGAFEVSPWCRLQVEQLARLGTDPLAW